MKAKFWIIGLALLLATLFPTIVKAQTTYSDNFQRANENPLKSPWVWFGGNFQLSNDVIEPQYGATSGYGGAYMYYGPSATDQFSQVTVKAVVGNSFVGAAVRMTSYGGGNAWYEFHADGPLGSQGYVILEKYEPTGGVYLNYTLATVNPGDVLKITAVGNVLTGYVNGVQIVQATDSDLPSGWFGATAYAGNLATDAEISAWSGGSLSSAPSGSLTFVAVPIKSYASCSPGQASYDLNFFYLCVAQNSWRRTPLGSF